MKVLFISSGNTRDGISTIVRKQGESLIKAGIDVTYFTVKGKGFLSYLKHVFILRKYLRKNVFNVYHAHYSLSSLTAALAGCKPLVVSLMGSDTKSGKLLKAIIKWVADKKWDTVIVKSSSMKRDIGIKKAVIIPNGVDLNLVKPSGRSPDGFSDKSILFASDPGKYVKNYQLAERARSLLINDQIKLKVVHSKSHRDIINEINNIDVLLVTSHWEGSPNIVKEAMACNVPVVSTNVGDVEWLFGNEPGHFITSFDPGDVAEKIRLALKFKDEFRLTNGRLRIIELGLDSESVAQKIIILYKKVLETRS